MRKFYGKNRILSCLALALACLAGGFTRAQASAQTTAQTDELLVPASYEQYLSLDAPTDVAVSESFTAIADKNTVYLYDKADGVYREYTHNFYPANPSSNNISKLQFDGDGNLYFLDQHELFVLPFESLEQPSVATETGFACTTFLVVGDTLYFTDAKAGNTQLLETTINGLTPDKQNRKTIVENGLTGIPALAFWNDELYFTNKGLTSTLYKFNPSVETARPIVGFKDKEIASFDTDVTAIAVADSTLTLCTNAKTFYAYALPRADEDAKLKEVTGAFTALYAYEEFVYAVNGKAVWQYDLQTGAFTDFEICANSARPNRLSGATDVLQVGNKLYIADNGNARISVFDTVQNAFVDAFDAYLPATYLSADSETLVLANQTQAALYSIKDENFGTLLASFDGFIDPVVGTASVYGTHYLATANHAYKIAFDKQENEYLMTATEKTSFHPTLLSADIYGNLYTLKNGQLYRFTEAEFISPDGVGTRVTNTVLTGVSKLAFDYEGDGYALANGTVYKLVENGASYSFTTPYIYASETQATAFTLSVEENAGYLLMDGNHLVKTQRFHLPTVKTIATQNADEQIFSTQSAQAEVVSVRENALLVGFDLQALNGAEHLPYLSYERSQTTLTALKLGETDGYHLIAVFDEEANAYFTYAVKKQFCQTLDKDDYLVSYPTGKTAWLTNGVNLYKFPYLTSLLTVTELSRGAQITLLGELNELDFDYYLIEVTTANGETAQGYIPKAYASLINAAPTPPTQTVVGGTDGDTDAVMRLIYLALGFAVICILTDFLLLRKKDEEDE